MSYKVGEQKMQEIITKAVVGKGKKETLENYFFDIENNPTVILGCWVVNHTFKAIKTEDDAIEVNGIFDINVWYAYSIDSDTKTDVITKRVTYSDEIDVILSKNVSRGSKEEIIAHCLKQPSCTNTKIGKGKMMITISKELQVEVIDEVRIKIDEKVED